MDFKLDIEKILQQLHPITSVVLSMILLMLGVWLKLRKTDLDIKKNKNEIQVAQIESMMQHIKLLSDELDRTRKQLTDLHDQNIELMVQLREANKRIQELENIIAHIHHIS